MAVGPELRRHALTDNGTRFHDRPACTTGSPTWPRPPTTPRRSSGRWPKASRGYSSDIFGPLELATRAQIATFLWRYAGQKKATEPLPFTDVPADTWYTKAVAWLAEAELTTGTSPGRFSPDRLVTRGEAVTFLWRLAGSPTDATEIPFDDVPESAFYRQAVARAVAEGVTTGISRDRFGGGMWVDRAQTVTFLHRFDQKVGIPEPPPDPPPDPPVEPAP
ncbi:MAG: S-layer homology domain-containing protein [Acidimicrobiales bacterium]